ncbi:FXYD domain-containing ion transport regulator 6-like isoform X1 [Oncorhynchus kisutch]|uniref:FXYD domain-containing ion transport regulator n=1 Tax=Oncorhynchus kisutch TaxID=8019 RepID=A0A8C7KSG7_ONCKI|nr:FXYD domain-containing ion transport regulator 6-like isoform X1 [Oncorhynchus kisutch]
METVLFFLFSLLVYVAVPVFSDGEKEKKEVDPFVYDYHSLRICGLVFGVVLFALGILLILSKSSYFSRKCRCCPNQEKKLKAPGDEEATVETLIVSKAKEPEPEPEAKAEN